MRRKIKVIVEIYQDETFFLEDMQENFPETFEEAQAKAGVYQFSALGDYLDLLCEIDKITGGNYAVHECGQKITMFYY